MILPVLTVRFSVFVFLILAIAANGQSPDNINVTFNKTATSFTLTFTWVNSSCTQPIYKIKLTSVIPNHFVPQTCPSTTLEILGEVTENTFVYNAAHADYTYNISVEAYCNTTLKATGFTVLSTVSSVPGPTNLSKEIEQIFNKQQNTREANISWNVSCDTNGNINRYIILLYNMDKKDNPVTSSNVSVSSNDVTYFYRLTNLLPRTNYNVYVQAIGYYEGEIGIDTPFTTGDILPPIPFVTVINETTHTFAIAWTANQTNTGLIAYFNITITTVGPDYSCNNCYIDAPINVTLDRNQTNYVHQTAQPAYYYNITVAAINSEGEVDSVPVAVHTLPQIPPTPVITDTNATAYTFALSWIANQTYQNQIDYFTVTITTIGPDYDCENCDIDIPLNVTLDSNETSYVFPSAQPAYYYNVTVAAINSAGEADSVPEGVHTPASIPGPPIFNITNDDIGPTDFNITWIEPQPANGEIIEYYLTITPLGRQYDYNRDDLNCTRNESVVEEKINGSILYYYFGNAKPYSGYNITLLASTVEGNGTEQVTNVTTTSYTPDAPINLKIMSLDNLNHNITWELPCNANGPAAYFDLLVYGNYTEDNNFSVFSNISIPFENGRYQYNTVETFMESFNYRVEVLILLNDNITGIIQTANTTTEAGIPGKPTNISINSYALNKTPTISWLQPLERKGNILSYDIQIVAIQPLYTSNVDCNPKKNIINYNSTEHHNNITISLDLYYYYEYSISVSASTSAGRGEFETFFCRSVEGVPEQINITKVSQLDVTPTEEYHATATIEFTPPCLLNGNLDNYTLTYYYYSNYKQTLLSYSSPFTINLTSPETIYNYYIETFNRNFSSSSIVDAFTSPSSAPIMTITSKNLPLDIGDTEVILDLKKEYFFGSSDVKYVALILSDRDIDGHDSIGNYESGSWPNITNASMGIFQLTKDRWSPFTNSDTATFSIGSGPADCSDLSSYCNKPLEPNKEYRLVVRAYTNSLYRNSPVIYFKTTNVKYVAIIVGSLFGILVPAGLGFLIFIIWRRKMPRLPGVLYIKSSSSTKHTPIINTSIPIKKFIQYYKFLENNPEKMKEQYMLLAEKSKEVSISKTTNFAQLPENKRKNRYINISPFDETRVKLLIDEDDDLGSDYINASYIRGYTGQIEYIATQGPLETSSRDFWKMILQENVSIIVMVSQFIENDKLKCYRYFPKNRDSMYIEDIEIRCSNELHFGIYCVRMLQIRKDNVQANVIHMQFLEWPDFEVPTGTEHMLQFCYQLRQRITTEGGCTVVHCSAGVGRTGTLIATDILLQAVNAKKNIDVFNTVFELRQQRINMVQTEKQYIYIHTLVRDHIDRPPTPDSIEAASPIYENVSVLQDQKNDPKISTSKKKLTHKESEESTF